MNDELRCPRCAGVFHDAEMAAQPDKFWECPLCHVVQHTACRGPLSDENEVKRIKRLEALAKAMRSAICAYKTVVDDPGPYLKRLDETLAVVADMLIELDES